MWRSFFLALGICLCILGAQGLVVERALLNGESPSPNSAFARGASPASSVGREIITPEWAPWSFLSAGAVVVLYSLTLAKGGAPG